MQQWVNRARADFIAMASKLFNHPEAHQRLLRCVVENMQPDKTADKLTVIRLLKLSVEGFSMHSCNPQLMLLTHKRAAHHMKYVVSQSFFDIDKRYSSHSVKNI